MRNATKRKGKVVLSALAAAGMAAWAGAPAAHGDFTVTAINMGVQSQLSNTGSGSPTQWQVWVLTATNTGTNGTGSTLAAVDVIIDTSSQNFASPLGALGIDIEDQGGGGGAAELYSANIDGATSDSFGIHANSAPVFGDLTGGTFIGVGSGNFNATNVSQIAGGSANKIVTNASQHASAGLASDLLNGQTSDYISSGNVSANYSQSTLNISDGSDPIMDNGLENGTQPTATVNAGAGASALLNGTVHSFELAIFAGTNSKPQFIPDGPGVNVPFANVVVPVGTSLTVKGSLGGESGGVFHFAPVVLGAAIPSSTLSISLTSTATNPNNIGTVTMVGTNGSYVPQTISTGANTVTANLSIKNGPGGDFNSATHSQIVGLDESGATSRAQLETDLQNALQATNSGATVFDPSNANGAGKILIANGDNVEILFPAGSVPGVNPEALSYDLSNYNTGTNGIVSISSITVLPEPTSLGALALGGLGLLSRRRRKARA